MDLSINFSSYPYDAIVKKGGITATEMQWQGAIKFLSTKKSKTSIECGPIKAVYRGNDGLTCVYKVNESDKMLKVDQSGERRMIEWLNLRILTAPRHTVRDKKETGAAFEEATANNFGACNYLILRNLALIPSANPNREIGDDEFETESKIEETTFANEVDILAWDGTVLWIVECKNFDPKKSRDTEKTWKNSLEDICKRMETRRSLLTDYLQFVFDRHALGEIPPISTWLVTAGDGNNHPCSHTDVHEEFPRCEKIPELEGTPSPELEGTPRKPLFWDYLEDLCPIEKLSFRRRLDCIAMVRDFRTKGLCLSQNRGLGNSASILRRQISGCAGSGKSVLLAFNAWQIDENKAITNGKLSDKLSNEYQNFDRVYLIAPLPFQVQILMDIMKTIRGTGLFQESPKPVAFLTVKQFLELKPSGKFAVFLDETQDLNDEMFTQLSAAVGDENLLCYAVDRLQSLKHKSYNKATVLNLAIQYRQPVPLYLACLALAYRWNSTENEIYLQPSESIGGRTVETLITDIWGIYNCYNTKSKTEKIAHSPYWTSETKLDRGNEVNLKRADWNNPGQVQADYRLSLRCDVHPASYWLNEDSSSFSVRLKIDGDLNELAPETESSVHHEDERDEISEHKWSNSTMSEVLWVRFEKPSSLKLRKNSIAYFVPQNMDAQDAYNRLSDKIKGREWPVVVIEGEPAAFSDAGDIRKYASQLMYLIASRATAVLYLIEVPNQNPSSREEFSKLKSQRIKRVGDCKHRQNFPGYLDCEFEKNIGLCWGREDSEPGIWWHLSWKNPDGDRISQLFGLNPPSTEEEVEKQEGADEE